GRKNRRSLVMSRRFVPGSAGLFRARDANFLQSLPEAPTLKSIYRSKFGPDGSLIDTGDDDIDLRTRYPGRGSLLGLLFATGLTPLRRIHFPLAHDLSPSPPTKTDKTMETMALVTPNCAMDKRSHTSS